MTPPDGSEKTLLPLGQPTPTCLPKLSQCYRTLRTRRATGGRGEGKFLAGKAPKPPDARQIFTLRLQGVTVILVKEGMRD